MKIEDILKKDYNKIVVYKGTNVYGCDANRIDLDDKTSPITHNTIVISTREESGVLHMVVEDSGTSVEEKPKKTRRKKKDGNTSNEAKE